MLVGRFLEAAGDRPGGKGRVELNVRDGAVDRPHALDLRCGGFGVDDPEEAPVRGGQQHGGGRVHRGNRQAVDEVKRFGMRAGYPFPSSFRSGGLAGEDAGAAHSERPPAGISLAGFRIAVIADHLAGSHIEPIASRIQAERGDRQVRRIRAVEPP